MLRLVTQSCRTPCSPVDCSLPGSSVHGDSSGKNVGVGCHFLLQGIFLTQALNLGLLSWHMDVLSLAMKKAFLAFEVPTNTVLSALKALTQSPPQFREGNGTPLQYSCLENPMDGGA